MSTSGIASSLFSQYPLGTGISPLQKELQQLGQDLTAGNLSASQSDFATLQQVLSQSTTSTASTVSGPIAQAFNQLATDLKSGNLTGAQQDYSTLQQDLRTQADPAANLLHHHHPHMGNIDPAPDQNPGQLLTQLGQALSTGNLSAARRAYSYLQAQSHVFTVNPAQRIEAPALPTSVSLSA